MHNFRLGQNSFAVAQHHLGFLQIRKSVQYVWDYQEACLL